MTLPASGTIDASGIYTEYYKSHISQEVNMDTMGTLYSIPSNPLSLNEFYNHSWAITSLPSIVEPDGGTTSSSGPKSGSTTIPTDFRWTATPFFDGYPEGLSNITMTIVCSVSGTYDSGSAGTAWGYCQYSLDGGSNYTTVCSDSASSGSGFSDSATSSGFSITPSNYTLFRIRIQYTIDDGTISSGVGSIRLAPTGIGASVNHIRVDLARDTISLDSGSYNAGTDAYSAGLTFG